MTREDEKWIRRTFELAQKGYSGASPNPYVGCVIVRNGRRVAEGAHLKFGGPHAEIHALKRAGENARNATLYTNLEPCCHWGKTPPCTSAILEAGIRRVVGAMADPNPLVQGGGFKALRENGIKVEWGILESRAKDLNRSFIHWIQKKRPYVILKAAVSMDGKIATSQGESQWITGTKTREFSHHFRTTVDGILVGAQTVRKDDPALTSHGKGRNPVRIIVTQSGRISKNARIFKASPPAWIIKGKSLSFQKLLGSLARKGISRLLIEGGGETAAWALESRMVNEIMVFQAPLLIGGKDAKTFFEGRGFGRLKDALKLEGVCTQKLGEDLLIRARIKN